MDIHTKTKKYKLYLLAKICCKYDCSLGTGTTNKCTTSGVEQIQSFNLTFSAQTTYWLRHWICSYKVVDSNPSCNADKLTALYLRQIVHVHKSTASNVTTIQYYKLFFLNSKSTEITTYFDNLQATNIFRFHLVYAFNYKLYPQLLVTPLSANISNAISTRQMLSNCPKSQQSTQVQK